MKNYVSPGRTLVVPAVAAAVASGDFVLQGTAFGVASHDAAIGEDLVLDCEGVYTLPKATGAITLGALVYWDATAENVTTTSTSNTLIGKAWSAQASGDGTVDVRLSQA